MPAVAKTRTDKSPSGDDEKPKPSSREGLRPLHVYLDELLLDAMSERISEMEPRPSKTSYIESLIRADLRKAGKWPPQPKE